jgi:nitrate/TMAO reductase-like tetraheme cytochrome c subunit
MPEQQDRPVLLLLTSHWISMLGVALVTLAGCSWLFVFPAHINGRADNPYIGILIFLIIPVVFFAGLALIPVGVFLAKRRIAAGISAVQDPKTAWRQAGVFFLVATVFNVIIASQLSYRAVEHMETAQFCGQSCHVMKPEFTAWRERAPHQSVVCVDCHVEPGVTGWVKSKMGGTRQLYNVVLNSFPRPIESGLESGRLAPSAETCEQCHSRDRVIGDRLRVVTKFADDQANTPTQTVLTMHVGGGTKRRHSRRAYGKGRSH